MVFLVVLVVAVRQHQE
jgi:hypothetical protein